MTDISQSGAGAISNNKGLQVLAVQYLDSGEGHHQILQGGAGCGIRQVPVARLRCKWSTSFNR